MPEAGSLISYFWFLKLAHRLGIRTRIYDDLCVIRSSGLLDPAWYLRNKAPIARLLVDPMLHYVRKGAAAGRNPHPLFDTAFYAKGLSAAARQQFNPLVHYQSRGGRSDKNPHRWFDSGWYRAHYDLTFAENVTPLLEYWSTGQFAGRSPHPLFEVDWYTKKYAGELGDGNPLVDYIYDGGGRVPHRALAGADRIPGGGPAADAAIRKAAAVRDPRAPKQISTTSFDEEGASAFAAGVRRDVASAGLIASPPTVSIITATKNRAEMLGEAVKSVLAQSYPHWELLVVDDGSTDGTRALVEGFDDARIRYLRNDAAGAASARNLGIAHAAGSLLAYLDSDNRWTPEFLETMVDYVLSSGLDLAYCGMRLESEEGVRFRGRPFDYEDLVRVNYIDLNAILHRRELVDRCGVFDTSLRRMIDWDLLLRYAKDAKVGYAPFVGVLYDEFKRYDRITVKESISWKFVVLNRYLIDWERLRAEAPNRDRNLVSIVIPVYGKFGITNDCLESLYRFPGKRPFEIVLVNNRSDQATLANLTLWAEARSNVRVEAGWTNFNFGLGCNVGFAASRGGTVVFLNNDTLATPGWLDPLADELATGTVGAVQPKLLYPDGTVQSVGAVFSDAGSISHMLYRGEPGDAPHVNRRRRLQAVHGACMAVLAEDFARLDGFDPHFVNGQEDIDLCLRLTAETGKTASIVPQSTIIHLEGKTRGGNPYTRDNRALFVERWQDRIKPDDRAIYESDGFSVESYEADGEGFAKRGIAAYKPVLTRLPSFAATARADTGSEDS
jgi:glycosyltransferase involved in cell wall biosynthesis